MTREPNFNLSRLRGLSYPSKAMAIFSRRILQRLLDENGALLSKKHLRKHVDDLNRMHETLTLAPEWEVAVLNAFSKVGKVLHESGPAGTSDLYFESRSAPKERFVADITTISDQGFDKKHAFDELDNELRRRVEERGFNPNHFHLDVQGNHPEIRRGHYYKERADEDERLLYKGGVKAELHMPASARFQKEIFNERWEQFLNNISSSAPHNVFRVYKPQDRINISISFAPGQRYGSSTHLSYKQINHLTENRVYEALADKADQVCRSGFDGPLGIILCDGGYSPFHATAHFSTHPIREVISYFLRNNPAIGFVATLVIKLNSYPRIPSEIKPMIYVNGNMSDDSAAVLEHVYDAVDRLPEAESDAFNAVNHLKGGNPQEGNKNGEFSMSSNEITISARTLMELLSGRLTFQEFSDRYDSIPLGCRTPGYTNFFDMRLKEGKLISDIQIEKSTTKDDDVITIKLRGPDPAISSFVVNQ